MQAKLRTQMNNTSLEEQAKVYQKLTQNNNNNSGNSRLEQAKRRRAAKARKKKWFSCT